MNIQWQPFLTLKHLAEFASEDPHTISRWIRGGVVAINKDLVTDDFQLYGLETAALLKLVSELRAAGLRLEVISRCMEYVQATDAREWPESVTVPLGAFSIVIPLKGRIEPAFRELVEIGINDINTRNRRRVSEALGGLKARKRDSGGTEFLDESGKVVVEVFRDGE